jgi:hypothetical protein
MDSPMPTPVQHLSIAEKISTADLPIQVQQLLARSRPAYFLGNIAPDMKRVTGQTREATHYSGLLHAPKIPGYQAMFRKYPELSCPHQLRNDHALFVAGYIIHLSVDETWQTDIYDQCFADDSNRGGDSSLSEDLLRTWLEEQDLIELSPDVGYYLSLAQPAQWHPSIADKHLLAWRDRIAKTLNPNKGTRTATIFASRHNLSLSDFRSVLASAVEMDSRVFSRVPYQHIDRFYRSAIEKGKALLISYLNNSLTLVTSE